MINLFVEFGFQPLNMEAHFDFELIERSSIISNFEARNITILLNRENKIDLKIEVICLLCCR